MVVADNSLWLLVFYKSIRVDDQRIKMGLKILVIGAGIAGPTVCYWLKRFGFSPVLIEKSAALRKGGQALDLRGVVVELAKKMGIYEHVCNMRTQVEIGRYVDTQGNILHEEVGERFGHRQGDDVEILRADLVSILMQAIADVPCYFSKTVKSIQQDAKGITVDFDQGNQERYALVIGADGVHSATRNMVFDRQDYTFNNLGCCLSTFSIPNYLHLSHTEVICETEQKLASLYNDQDPNIARAGFMFRSNHLLKNIRDQQEQQQFLLETYRNFGWETPKILELMQYSHDFYFDLIEQVKMPSWTKGRVALLGDAAYCASPLSGQGNNLAMVGAYILAGELKKAQGDYVQAFARYNQILRPWVEATQSFGAFVGASFLVFDKISEEKVKERAETFTQQIERLSTGFTLPEYE